jgi:hypothetical protein
MIGELEKILCESSSKWGLGPLRDVRHFVYNNFHPHCTNINVFWFSGKKDYPIAFTRISRDPAPLQHEHASLQRIHDSGVLCTPRPLAFSPLSVFHCLWMTGLPGCRVKYGDPGVGSYLTKLVDALGSIHNQIRSQPSKSVVSRTESFLTQPLQSLCKFGGTTVASLFQKGYQDTSMQLLEGSLSTVPQHGDMSAGNVLRDGKNFFFVDWENFNILDFPAFDLFTLLTSILYGFGDDPGAWPASVTRQMPSSIHRYCKQISIPFEVAEHLFYLTLLNWFHIQYLEGREAGYNHKFRMLESAMNKKGLWLKTLFGTS